MEDKGEKKTIKEEVLGAIKSGRARMKPRWRFILNAALWVAGALILVLALLFLASFIFAALRESGLLFALAHGARGWLVFLRLLPWVLIFLSIFFVIVLEVLVRHFSFAYRKPLFYSLLGIILLVFIGGASTAPWHRRAFRSAREHRLPFGSSFYHRYGMMGSREVERGIITDILPSGFIIKNSYNGTSTVVVTERTRLPRNADFKTGDSIIIFGSARTEGIEAFGIRMAEE